MRQVNRMLLLTLAVSILVSCVTQKRRDELSTLGKIYHNTTAKYNGYFNANELLIASIAKLDEQHHDNFKQILPVYDYVDVDNAQAVAADLDNAIQKVSVVVNLHRASHWTDDSYLLVGKAQYLKKDYEAAEETLRYMVEEFNPEKMAARAKKTKKATKKPVSGTATRPGTREKEDKPDLSQLSEKEQQRYLRKQEKEREKYNKEVKKRKKQEMRQRKKARKNAARKRPNASEKPRSTADSLGLSSAKPSPLELKKQEEEMKKLKKKRAEEEKEKKEAEKAAQNQGPESYFLKHRPSLQEGTLWLARTCIERRKFEEAMRLMLQLERDPKTFEDVLRDLTVVKAHYFLRQGDYEQALAPLEQAIAAAEKHTDKARYAYIIAQIHQRAGRQSEAYAGFERALRYGPEYEMEFNGRLSIVENGWRSKMFSAEDARGRYNRMLRDVKNLEFQDQIYYALANLELESGNRKEGIKALEQSLAKGTQNQLQRAESYLRLANLYLEEEQFVPAQHYFDSTLNVLPTSDERYAEVKRWRDNLTDIAQNIEIITYQDSLLRIAALSDGEKRELATRIKKERDEKRLAELASSAGASQPEKAGGLARKLPGTAAPVSLAAGGQDNGAAASQSTFFAYDDRNVKRGKRDFFREWGDRRLEDNWRRSSKTGSTETDIAAQTPEQETAKLPEDEISTILQDVPKTDGEKTAAQLKVQEAMFKLGVLYRERLGNNRKCVEVLEEFVRRFDRANYLLDAWYYLYLAYTDLDQPDKAKAYADRIIEKYPSSNYAKVLRNPAYAAELKNEQNKLVRYYDDAYAAFTGGDYRQAYQKSQDASGLFGAQNPLQPKFALLAAMSTGNLQGREAYITALKDLIARYPESPEQTRAREILRLLGEKTSGLPGGAEEQPAAQQFEVGDDQLHYVLVVLGENAVLNDSKVALSNYHLQYHKLEKLTITNAYLGEDGNATTPILVVRRFKNKGEAMAYYQGVQQNKKDFLKTPFEVFAISTNNYREILRSKSIEGYREFFAQHYLR